MALTVCIAKNVYEDAGGPQVGRAGGGNVTVRWTLRSGVQWWIGRPKQPVVLKEGTCGKVFEVPADGFYQVNPTVGEVMVEGPSKRNKDRWSGRDSGNRIVVWDVAANEECRMKNGELRIGTLVKVKITEAHPQILLGELVCNADGP